MIAEIDYWNTRGVLDDLQNDRSTIGDGAADQEVIEMLMWANSEATRRNAELETNHALAGIEKVLERIANNLEGRT